MGDSEDMNANITYRTRYEDPAKAEHRINHLKRLILRTAKALSFDADAISKSKDWPYLWPN